MKYRTTVNLDRKLILLAEGKGLKNISEFCNNCLEFFVTEGRDIPNGIREAARAAEEKAREEFNAQHRLCQEVTAAQDAAEQYRVTRDSAVREATITILSTVHNFSRYLPENDIFGDYADALDGILNKISTKAGYEVELSDVVSIWKELSAQVSPREHGASSLYQSVPAPSHSPKEMRANVQETPTD